MTADHDVYAEARLVRDRMVFLIENELGSPAAELQEFSDIILSALARGEAAEKELASMAEAARVPTTWLDELAALRESWARWETVEEELEATKAQLHRLLVTHGWVDE